MKDKELLKMLKKGRMDEYNERTIGRPGGKSDKRICVSF